MNIPRDLSTPATLGDYDGDGAPDLMVKYNRISLIDYLNKLNLDNDGTEIDRKLYFTITGEFKDGTPFGGIDELRVVNK